jgi:hypothetical protein
MAYGHHFRNQTMELGSTPHPKYLVFGWGSTPRPNNMAELTM